MARNAAVMASVLAPTRHILALHLCLALLALTAAAGGPEAPKVTARSQRRSAGGQAAAKASRRRRTATGTGSAGSPTARITAATPAAAPQTRERALAEATATSDWTARPADIRPTIRIEGASVPAAQVTGPSRATLVPGPAGQTTLDAGAGGQSQDVPPSRYLWITVLTSPTDNVTFRMPVRNNEYLYVARVLQRSIARLNSLRPADSQFSDRLADWSADAFFDRSPSVIGGQITEDTMLPMANCRSIRYVRHSDAPVAVVYYFGAGTGSKSGICRLPMQTGLDLFEYATFCYQTLVGLNVELSDFSPPVATWHVLAKGPDGQMNRTDMPGPGEALAAIQGRHDSSHVMIHMFDPNN